jgi:hypothetical protein
MHEQKCASLPLECMKNKIIKHKIFHKWCSLLLLCSFAHTKNIFTKKEYKF